MATIEFSEAFFEIFKRPPSHLMFEFQADSNSIKHTMEYLGIPHTEVGLVQVNGQAVNFNYRPQAADHVWVEPLAAPINVTRPSLLRSEFPQVRFIVDECVANLTSKLRMLGYDTVSDRNWHDPEIAQIAAREKRIVLTRDRGLLMRKEIEWGRFIRAKNPLGQIREVIHFFGLNLQERALQRCLECNGILHEVPKAQVAPLLAPKTLIYYENFSQCDRCGKVYWEGSHYSKMVESFDKLL